MIKLESDWDKEDRIKERVLSQLDDTAKERWLDNYRKTRLNNPKPRQFQKLQEQERERLLEILHKHESEEKKKLEEREIKERKELASIKAKESKKKEQIRRLRKYISSIETGLIDANHTVKRYLTRSHRKVLRYLGIYKTPSELLAEEELSKEKERLSKIQSLEKQLERQKIDEEQKLISLNEQRLSELEKLRKQREEEKRQKQERIKLLEAIRKHEFEERKKLIQIQQKEKEKLASITAKKSKKKEHIKELRRSVEAVSNSLIGAHNAIKHHITLTHRNALRSIGLHKTSRELRRQEELRKEKQRVDRLQLLKRQREERKRQEQEIREQEREQKKFADIKKREAERKEAERRERIRKLTESINILKSGLTTAHDTFKHHVRRHVTSTQRKLLRSVGLYKTAEEIKRERELKIEEEKIKFMELQIKRREMSLEAKRQRLMDLEQKKHRYDDFAKQLVLENKLDQYIQNMFFEVNSAWRKGDIAKLDKLYTKIIMLSKFQSPEKMRQTLKTLKNIK